MHMHKITYLSFFHCLLIAFGAFALSDVFGDVIYYEGGGGVVVGEAETFSSRTGNGVRDWLIVPSESAGAGTFTNARGGAFMQCLPDLGGAAGAPNTAPELMYQMQIETPGTYRLYFRKEANTSIATSASDSLFFDVVELKDGTTPAFGTSTNLIPDWYETVAPGVALDGDFSTQPWETDCQAEVNSASASGSSAEWVIPTAGVYTLRFSMREDGVALDAWVFQLASLPAPTGDGPPVSPMGTARVIEAAGDTYLKRSDTNVPHGAEETLLVKNHDATTHGTDRCIYLRFNLDDLNGWTPTNAILRLVMVSNGPSSTHDTFVAVIAEDATAEHFDEATLTPDNSDVFDNSDDVGVDWTKIQGGGPIGSFEVTLSDEGNTVTFDDPDLLTAILADTDGVISLVLYQTVANGGAPDSFASKENTSFYAPRLVVGYQPPHGTLIVIR